MACRCCHPSDLATLTDAGPVIRRRFSNSSWNFTTPGVEGHPYRRRPRYRHWSKPLATPPDMTLNTDLKADSATAAGASPAVAQMLTRTGAAGRSIVYSTNADITAAVPRGRRTAGRRKS